MTPPVQEQRLCPHPGCGKPIRRPQGASSLCPAGHPIPSTKEIEAEYKKHFIKYLKEAR